QEQELVAVGVLRVVDDRGDGRQEGEPEQEPEEDEAERGEQQVRTLDGGRERDGPTPEQAAHAQEDEPGEDQVEDPDDGDAGQPEDLAVDPGLWRDGGNDLLGEPVLLLAGHADEDVAQAGEQADRKSTRLNSSHVKISYAVFCLKKKT